MITRRRFPAENAVIFLATVALILLGPAGPAAAEPRLDRMLAVEQSLTRTIERAQRRLSRFENKLDRAFRDLERSCAGESIDRKRRARCSNLSDSLEQSRERLDYEAKRLARYRERLVKLSKKIERIQARAARHRENLAKRLARAEVRVSKAEQRITTMQAFIQKHEGSEAKKHREQVEQCRAQLVKSKRMYLRWTSKRDDYRAALESLSDG